MRKIQNILILALTLLSATLNAQYWTTDGNGNYGVRYGSFSKTSGPVEYVTQETAPPVEPEGETYIIGLGGSIFRYVYDSINVLPDYTVNNLAVAGDNTIKQRTAWNGLDEADQDSADYVFISLGANDIAIGADSITMVARYEGLLSDISADINEDCQVIMFAMTPARGSEYFQDYEHDILMDVNKWIMTEPTGVDRASLLNWNLMVGSGDSLKSLYNSTDNIHPNAEGKYQLEQNMLSIIERPNINVIMRYDYESETSEAWQVDDYETYYNPNIYSTHWYDSGDSLVWVVSDEVYTGISQQSLRVKNRGDDLWHGMETSLTHPGDSVYREMNIDFIFAFDSAVYINGGGKLSGFESYPRDPDFRLGHSVPDDYGFTAKMNFSDKIYDYHYDSERQCESETWYCMPWSSLTGEEYSLDSIHPNPGVYYKYTIHNKLNTFTGTTPNDDGVMEGWINGRPIFKVDSIMQYDDYDTWFNLGMNGICIDHFYGGGGPSYTPWWDLFGYYAEVVIYQDTSYSEWGTGEQSHDTASYAGYLDNPTNNELFYDSKITSAGSFTNAPFDTCQTNMYLIDAGENNTVSFEITTTTWGGSDDLYIYDGNTTDADYLLIHRTYTSDLSRTITSTQRYMWIRVDHHCGGAFNNLTGTITFNSS